MLDQEYVENEEKLSVSKSELDKDKSNLMSSEKEMNDMKDSIKKLNNTIKDLTQLLSPENLDLLERIVTEVRSLKQAEEQHENLKNTLSSKQEKYDFILVRRDEINQNKSEVQSAQSLMSEVAENLTAAEQLKSDLKLLQTLQVDKANRLASLLVEYEKVKAEHGELAQKCE
jgi:chromosome segregation ATPase